MGKNFSHVLMCWAFAYNIHKIPFSTWEAESQLHLTVEYHTIIESPVKVFPFNSSGVEGTMLFFFYFVWVDPSHSCQVGTQCSIFNERPFLMHKNSSCHYTPLTNQRMRIQKSCRLTWRYVHNQNVPFFVFHYIALCSSVDLLEKQHYA